MEAKRTNYGGNETLLKRLVCLSQRVIGRVNVKLGSCFARFLSLCSCNAFFSLSLSSCSTFTYFYLSFSFRSQRNVCEPQISRFQRSLTFEQIKHGCPFCCRSSLSSCCCCCCCVHQNYQTLSRSPIK